PSVSAESAVVIDEASMAVLYGKHPNRQALPASLTKVATAILAIESGRLDDVVENDVDSHDMPGSSLMGLRPDDTFSLRDRVYGLMLRSGNDAALSIGRHLSGTGDAFVEQMNLLCDAMGLQNTHFTNAHGLHNGDHYSSA